MSRRLCGLTSCWVLMTVGSLAFVPAVAQGLQDPTRPPGLETAMAKPVPARPLALDSILFSKNRRVAVIEGEALREGQGFDNVRVIRIYANRVLVTDNDRERVLYLERLPQIRETQ